MNTNERLMKISEKLELLKEYNSIIFEQIELYSGECEYRRMLEHFIEIRLRVLSELKRLQYDKNYTVISGMYKSVYVTDLYFILLIKYDKNMCLGRKYGISKLDKLILNEKYLSEIKCFEIKDNLSVWYYV